MFKKLKNFKSVIILSIVSIFLCVLTFLSFINPKLLNFSKINLQLLLIADVLILIIFFIIIFFKSLKIYSLSAAHNTGSQTSKKYIIFFASFTFIPSFLIAIFSLFIFNFGLENFFNTQISQAVKNSYDVAKSYSEQNKKTLESDVFLMSVGLNRASPLFYSAPNRFSNIARSEKLLRRVDDIFLIDSASNIIFFDSDNPKDFIKPTEEEFNKALEGVTVQIINGSEYNTSAMIKLTSLIDTYLYISRDIDPEIIKYLNETEQAVNFYYSVENKQTGIKITFAIIYILLVGLLLFASIIISMAFADRLTKPIINLIGASEDISKGNLETKVPEIEETDEEFIKLNENFNNMISRLKEQQNKLLVAERYSAWETVARKLAHEIKNPLTPIQLSIDRLKDKFEKKISEGQEEFVNYLSTINRQIKDIENLVNEFSSFARMPNPVMQKQNLCEIIKRAVDFYKLSTNTNIKINSSDTKVFMSCDEEQIYRAFINLIKNAEDSIVEKQEKDKQFKGKIDIEIDKNNHYINVDIVDNGIGIKDTSHIMTPYFTTKKQGTGLGLPIVNKIINEHGGELKIENNNPGAIVKVTFPIL